MKLLKYIIYILTKYKMVGQQAILTALVPSSHRRDEKKYVAPGRRITDAREEQKRSRYKQRTLLIKDFKYGSSLSIFIGKNNKAQRSQSQSNFPHDNNAAREFDSG
jgi:PBP1b-binding outer membrane lipoprotein LpoB